MLLLCLFFVSPSWAGEVILYKEAPPALMQLPVLEEEPKELTPEEIFLFTPSPGDDNTSPYSVYKGKEYYGKQTLKGGVFASKKSGLATKYSKDGSSVTLQSVNKKIGEVELGDINADGKARSLEGAYALFSKDKFGVRSSFLRNDYRPELSKNSISISPEMKLGKSLILRSSYSAIMEQKGHSNGVALEYSMQNSKIKLKPVKNLRFEVNASTMYDASNDPTRRFGFNTKYSF